MYCGADDECSVKGLDSIESSCAKTNVCAMITNCLNRIASTAFGLYSAVKVRKCSVY